MLERLTLDQLRVLVAVAEAGSFSAAARRLGRVQSAISQSVQTLESALGVQLFSRAGKMPTLTETGRALLDDARHLIHAADALRSRASSIASGVEPDLPIAVDAMFPNAVLMESLRALAVEYPWLPVTVFTEGLGGPEERLRARLVRIAISVIDLARAADLESEFFTSVRLVPVVAAGHALAEMSAPLARADLEPQLQLVLTDRTPLTHNTTGSIYSHRIWRFADQHARLDFLLAGFGWCNMPAHMVEGHIAAGRLVQLELKEQQKLELPLHIVHERGRPPGIAGRWLLEDLRRRIAAQA